MPPGRRHSLEEALHGAAPEQALLVFPRDGGPSGSPTSSTTGRSAWSTTPNGRAGATTCPTVLGDRYDAFIWCDESQAVRPLRVRPGSLAEPETYPSGV